MSQALQGNKNLYADCENIKRSKPDVRVTEEIAKEIGRNYRTLPAFEKGLFDHVYTKHYSLHTNQLLRCRWLQYKKHIEQRQFAPCQFPNNRDLHFYNGCIRFLPSESIYRFPEHRMRLRPGPGVDFRGQVPIPQELLMKRGKTDKQDGAKVPKFKRENKLENK
ncbi:uncharacterized protein [Maniola hyperantus]|uniref:uncharacterized protein n=1 Tax=Aphantopus hyperantus TaxID=2795564 RepID=UPI001569A880|nr:uncharacterized protein LOC117994229 [Maniola hyperantus]